MYGILALSLKTTNWCNLNCSHCREDSGRNVACEYMSVDKIEDYITQFQELPLNLSNRITIDGGEPMLPYFKKDENYIPTALTLIAKAGAIPVIKTNGTWGRTYTDRNLILKSLAKNANFTGRAITLNMSVDEFHENISGVSNIIADVVFSDYLRSAIHIEISGFNTIGSIVAVARLRSDLKEKEITTIDSRNDDFVAYNNNGGGIHVSTNYLNDIYRLGRAQRNFLYTVKEIMPGCVNTIQLDNEDNAVLNHTVREQVNNRDLASVLDCLITSFNRKQK